MHQALAQARTTTPGRRIVVTLGEAETWSRGVPAAVELFERSAESVPERSALCAHLHVRAAGTLIVAGDVRHALGAAAAADAAAARAGLPAEMFAAGTVRAIARLLAGEPDAVEALGPSRRSRWPCSPAGRAASSSPPSWPASAPA